MDEDSQDLVPLKASKPREVKSASKSKHAEPKQFVEEVSEVKNEKSESNEKKEVNIKQTISKLSFDKTDTVTLKFGTGFSTAQLEKISSQSSQSFVIPINSSSTERQQVELKKLSKSTPLGVDDIIGADLKSESSSSSRATFSLGGPMGRSLLSKVATPRDQ
jgi:hypothetical protein